jgi:hypothetical protein
MGFVLLHLQFVVCNADDTDLISLKKWICLFLEIAGIKILNADVLRRVRDSSGNPFFEAFRR